MSPRARGLAALLCSAALLGGCTKEEPAPNEDRTLAKLRQEVDRVSQGGATSGPPTAPTEDPNARLAGLAAGRDEDEVKQLAPPASNGTVHVGSCAVKLTNLEALHSLRGSSKVGLTTDELFLRTQLIIQNVGTAAADLSLSGAKVVDAVGKEYPIARDAQTLAGTRKLDQTWEPDRRDSAILLFELPPAAIAPGLTLVLPTIGGEARIALQ
jgi:hypothetical protein